MEQAATNPASCNKSIWSKLQQKKRWSRLQQIWSKLQQKKRWSKLQQIWSKLQINMEQAATDPVSAMEQAATEPVPSIHQVFLNHRGPDVKRTLASLIYRRLTGPHGLHVFLDKEEIHAGDTFSPVIQAAIESASVHICIFSKRYAESSWCLEELYQILRSHHDRHTKIIAVFCDVEPSDLRYIERRPYAKAFKKHRRRGKDIDKWKTALNEASNISGLVFKTNQSDHGELLESIVKLVMTEVVKWAPLEVTTYPVGLDQSVEDLHNKIVKLIGFNNRGIVGIVGVAGVGKSTLAKHFYNLKRSEFSRCCFLSEVGKFSRLPSLQQKLLRDLLGYGDLHVDDTSTGKNLLQDGLIGIRVLIVFDGVYQNNQINRLLDIDALGQGSLILITSSDQDTIRCRSRKAKYVLHKVEPLQEKHARELFCQHAFLQPEPHQGFEDLVDKFLKICDRLPLFLTVMGEQLSQLPDRKSWESQLENLSRGLPDSIIKKLKVKEIYETLNSEEKKMFLDIAYFFTGEEIGPSVRVLEALGYNDARHCLNSLRKKCLVDYEEHNGDCALVNERITMYNHIRELARHIEKEEFLMSPSLRPIRIRCSNDIQTILQLKLEGVADSLKIRGIRKDQIVPTDCTNKIKAVGLRLFVIEVPIDLSSFFGSWDLEGTLVWLRLRNAMSIYFPDKISLEGIKVLEIQGDHGDPKPLLDRFIEGPMAVGMPVLRDFILKSTSIPVICIPEGVYPSLDTVDFSANFRLTQVIGLPSTLTRLSLQNCGELKTLTNLSNLVNLKVLNISECVGLKTLNVEGLTSLEEIKALACWKLKRIEGLSLLEQLKSVYISTYKRCIWNDICKYVTSSPHEMLSTAIFSSMADEKKTLDEPDMRRTIKEKFHLEVVDILSDTTRSRSHVNIENLHSHGAILMCFISSSVSGSRFRVQFDASNSGGPVKDCIIRRENGSGKSLDVFMWRADCHFFSEYKDYSNIDVYCSELLESALDAHVERGWMVLVHQNTDFVEVCYEFINVLI